MPITGQLTGASQVELSSVREGIALRNFPLTIGDLHVTLSDDCLTLSNEHGAIGYVALSIDVVAVRLSQVGVTFAYLRIAIGDNALSLLVQLIRSRNITIAFANRREAISYLILPLMDQRATLRNINLPFVSQSDAMYTWRLVRGAQHGHCGARYRRRSTNPASKMYRGWQSNTLLLLRRNCYRRVAQSQMLKNMSKLHLALAMGSLSGQTRGRWRANSNRRLRIVIVVDET
jgi:hypothetical protein